MFYTVSLKISFLQLKENYYHSNHTAGIRRLFGRVFNFFPGHAKFVRVTQLSQRVTQTRARQYHISVQVLYQESRGVFLPSLTMRCDKEAE